MTWSKLSSGFRLDSIAKGAPQAEIRDGDDDVASSANFGHEGEARGRARSAGRGKLKRLWWQGNGQRSTRP